MPGKKIKKTFEEIAKDYNSVLCCIVEQNDLAALNTQLKEIKTYAKRAKRNLQDVLALCFYTPL